MVQSLQLGTAGNADDQQSMRRLNRLPIIVVIVIIVLFFGVVIVGLSWRGLSFNRGNELDTSSKTPATTFGDQLKRGVTDGIIGEPEQREVFQPTPVIVDREPVRDPVVERRNEIRTERRSQLEPEAEWKARLKREQDEQVIRETQRQRMASLQARATALDSPLKVDVSEIQKNASESRTDTRQPLTATTNSASDLYAAAMNPVARTEHRSERSDFEGGLFQSGHQGSWLPTEPSGAAVLALRVEAWIGDPGHDDYRLEFRSSGQDFGAGQPECLRQCHRLPAAHSAGCEAIWSLRLQGIIRPGAGTRRLD